MVGPSRKHFVAHAGPRRQTTLRHRRGGDGRVLGGAHIVRVHDVREMRAATDLADEILRTRASEFPRPRARRERGRPSPL